MLSKINQKRIYSKLNNIYKTHCPSEKIYFYKNEIVKLINRFNKKNNLCYEP